MKYIDKLYTSCEPTKQETREWLTELKKDFDKAFAYSKVPKAEIQRITGISSHTCFDACRNFRFSTLVVLFRAVEQVCQICINARLLVMIGLNCIGNRKNLVVRQLDPDEEPRADEQLILQHLPDRKGSQNKKKK